MRSKVRGGEAAKARRLGGGDGTGACGSSGDAGGGSECGGNVCMITARDGGGSDDNSGGGGSRSGNGGWTPSSTLFEQSLEREFTPCFLQMTTRVS